jgi:heme O synthase-like polyprenyltransferase
MELAPKITVLTVILAVVSAILADRVFHSVSLSVFILLAVGFFLPLVLSEQYKRIRN